VNKTLIYSAVFARYIIIILGFIFKPLFALLYALGHIGNIYLTNLTAFIHTTKQQIAYYDQQLKKDK
jgi:hypothetical protein